MSKFIPIKAEETQYPNTWNPLRFLTERQIEMMLDNARSGRISQLQALYALVEQNCLTLAMCISRRESALPDWTIKRRDTRRYRSYDEKLAQEQEAFLYDQFVQCEDSGTLLHALDTLHKAVFRGLGVVLPIYDKFGLQKILSLDPWNFAIDFTKHNEFGQYPLYWNPAGTDIIDFKTSLERIPDEEVVANFASAPIDSFGLQIFLAQQMGMESYNKLIARKGLPATYIIAPEDLPQENLQTWAEKAVDCARGGSGAFPYGSNVITQDINPAASTSIENFLEYMSKQIVLASTGGTLASLAQATGLGSNLADVQNDVFKSIVRKDAYKIGDLINRGIAKKLLNDQFPGKPHLAYFDLADEEKQSADKYLDDAVKAKNAGLSIDINQISELTGYKLTPVEPEKKEDETIWNVPRLNAEKPEDKNAVEEWRVEVRDEEKPTEVANSEAEEAVEKKVDREEVKKAVPILKAFDKVLAPIRELFARLVKAKDKAESDGIVQEINDEIQKIEQSDDNELVKAVETLMLDAFEEKKDEE